MGGASSPGQQLGPGLEQQAIADELSRFKRFGFVQDRKKAQHASNTIFARLGSDNPGKFAAFFRGLDPDKTISEQLGLELPDKFVKPKVETPADNQVPDQKAPESPFEEKIIEAKKAEVQRAKARKGRSSTIVTSGRGLETEPELVIPTLLGKRRNRGKTLLGR
jgi:hypothetical protein